MGGLSISRDTTHLAFVGLCGIPGFVAAVIGSFLTPLFLIENFIGEILKPG